MATPTVLFTGKTRTTPTRREGARNEHGTFDIRTSSPGAQDLVFEATVPHPTAEQLFAGAWSACYTAAIGLIAMQRKVKVPADLAVEIVSPSIFPVRGSLGVWPETNSNRPARTPGE